MRLKLLEDRISDNLTIEKSPSSQDFLLKPGQRGKRMTSKISITPKTAKTKTSSSSSSNFNRSFSSSIVRYVNLIGLVFIVLNGIFNPSNSVEAMSAERKLELRDLVRKTWDHGFDNYMNHAFPDDELRPISCRGLSYDYSNPNNHAVNDVMGDFLMTLIDTLDTFVVFGDHKNFSEAVQKIITNLPSFDLNVKIQVFETTIRVLGGLLSGHLFSIGQVENFKFPPVEGYKGELLFLAEDLANRMLPAFQASRTGIPYARVNLRHGVDPQEGTETCTAGAGSLLLEFATLSRLVNKPVYEAAAKKAFYALWDRRSNFNLLGNTINIRSGYWVYGISSIGAGIDSFYEYIFKSYILLQDDSFLDIWDKAYESAMTYMRSPDGFMYHGVNMQTGSTASTTIDSLSAFWPGLQILAGDVEAAIQSHMVYANLWKRYSGIPEVFDTFRRTANVLNYPLRPEFIESNYYLYRATKDEFYLEMAERVLMDLIDRTWVECGLASISDLVTGKLDDRMHSFMLSETLKYLYLTFDEDNPINTSDEPFIFTTEGHLLIIPNAEKMPENQRRQKKMPDYGAEEGSDGANLNIVTAPASTKDSLDQWTARYTCPAFAPSKKSLKYSSDLKLSVQGRTDFEYAKMIVGIDDESDIGSRGSNISKNHYINNNNKTEGWLSYGLSEVPVTDEHLIELLFTLPGSSVVEPDIIGSNKVEILNEKNSGGGSGGSGGDNGIDDQSTVIVKNLTGLSFSIRRRNDLRSEGESFQVVKIGSHRLPKNSNILIRDPSAIKALRSRDTSFSERDKDHLAGIRVTYEPGLMETTSKFSIDRAAMMATFGPDVRIPTSAEFSINNTTFELTSLDLGNEYGCNPINPDSSSSKEDYEDEQLIIKEEDEEDEQATIKDEDEDEDEVLDEFWNEDEIRGKVVLIERGNCTFSEKIENLARSGVKGVLVSNHEESLLIPTSEKIPSRNPSDPKVDLNGLGDGEKGLISLIDSIPMMVISRQTGNDLRMITNHIKAVKKRAKDNYQRSHNNNNNQNHESSERVRTGIGKDGSADDSIGKVFIEVIEYPFKNMFTDVYISGYKLSNVALDPE